MLDDPHVGDRDPRTEDRQLLLDALLAATDRLIVTYTGNDERTNVAAAAGGAGRRAARRGRPHGPADRARATVVVRHPLQPFDPRNFTPRRARARAARGASTASRSTARARSTGERAEPGPFLAGPLPAATPALVELDDLVRFVAHPVRAFLRQRLGDQRRRLRRRGRGRAARSSSTASSSGGSASGCSRRGSAGASHATAVAAEIARGTLPPGELAEPVIAARSSTVVEAIVARRAGAARRRAAGVGRRQGRAAGRPHAERHGARRRRRRAAHRHLLAREPAPPARGVGAAARADRGAPGAAVRGGDGRPRASDARRAEVTIARIPPLAADPAGRRERALDHLAVLLDLYDRGHARAAAARLPARRPPTRRPRPTAATPSRPAASAWESAWNFDKEDASPSTSSCSAACARSTSCSPSRRAPDEAGDGWDATETDALRPLRAPAVGRPARASRS